MKKLSLWCCLGLACLFGGSASCLATSAEEAAAEVTKALSLTPNVEQGRELYKLCSVCHLPEGWGTVNGHYPQIAGQLYDVIIKQLADIRARNRDNPTMFPFSMPSSLGGAQEMANVAAYISALPMSPRNDKGRGRDLALGERLYKENCVDCHGENGEGDSRSHSPRIHGQHYRYLVRQFRWIKIGKRRNADKEMVKQIQGFTGRDIRAVMDYVSRLRPPAEMVAPNNWQNPDFPRFERLRMPSELTVDGRPR